MRKTTSMLDYEKKEHTVRGMEQVGVSARYISIAVCVVCFAWPNSAKAVGIEMSQVIQPLVCTVDVITVGQTKTIRLQPAECVRAPEARAILQRAQAIEAS